MDGAVEFHSARVASDLREFHAATDVDRRNDGGRQLDGEGHQPRRAVVEYGGLHGGGAGRSPDD